MASTVARIPSSARAFTSAGQLEGPLGGDRCSPPDERGERIAPHEGIPPPALAALDRLEQEPGAVAHDEQERAHRRQGVGHQLAPHRNDAVVTAQLGKDVAPGTVRWRPGRRSPVRRRAPGRSVRVAGPERSVEARPLPGVACPVPVLVHHQRAGRRRRSRSGRPAPTGGPPRSPPCTSTRPGCGSRTRTSRSAASGAGPRRPCSRA